MQFTLPEEQAILRDTVEKFVHDRYGAGQRRQYRATPVGYSLAHWRDLADLGVLGLPFSEADGGLNAGPHELVAVMEVIGAGFVAEPLLEELIFAAGLLACAGDAAQKREWLPRVIAGHAHLAVAHAEHSARFNLADVRVRVRSDAGRHVLDGEKIMVPLAPSADGWIVSARRRGDNADPAGIEFHWVSPGADGIERRDLRLVDGSVASTISFKGAVSAGRLPGGQMRKLLNLLAQH